MNPISLSGNDLFWIIVVAIICLAVSWTTTFFCLRNKENQMNSLLMEGNLIRLLTVIFVVFSTTVLAVMGALNEAVSAIFAGIVGYVLGSMGGTKSGKNQ